MSILKKLFSRNGSGTTMDKNDIVVEEKSPGSGFEKLFKDGNPPLNETEAKSNNLLKTFFEKNFGTIGYNSGYEFHTVQCLDKGMKKIVAEYQHLLGILVDEKENQIYDLNLHKIQSEGISESILRQLDLKISQLNKTIEKCSEELELSESFRGHIEFPISKFKAGFEKGMTQYYNEKFFAQSTGLFN